MTNPKDRSNAEWRARKRRRQQKNEKPGSVEGKLRKSQGEPDILRSWLPYVWIALAVLLLYCPTLFFDLTYFDDDVFVKTNYNFNREIANLEEAFKTTVFVTHPSEYYRPLLTVSFMVNAMLGGENPGGYHLFNVLFHILASLLFFRLLLILGYSRLLSLFCGLILAVHPVLTQVVAWIPGRNDSLLAIFVFASLMQFIAFARSHKVKNGFWHLVFLAAALFTKESGAGLLLICPAYLLLIANQKLERRRFIGLGLGWLVILGLWLLLRSNAIEKNYQVAISGMAGSFFTNLGAAIPYLGKVIFPFNLSVFPVKEDSPYLYGYLAVFLIGGLILLSKTRRPGSLAWGAFFSFIFLVPGLLITKQSLASPLMEQRMLLPLAGLLMVFLETDPARKMELERGLLRWAALLALAIFSILAFVHAGHFRNNISFWENAVQTSPHSPLAHAMLGEIYRNQERLPEAEAEFSRSLELKPDNLMAIVDLGVLYMQEKRWKEAETLFSGALNLKIKSEQVRELIQSNLRLVQSAQRAKPSE